MARHVETYQKLKAFKDQFVVEVTMNQELITPDILATRWDIKRETLSQWRWNGRGPQFLKLGRKVLYRIQDIEAFEANNLRQDNSQSFA